VLLEQPANVRRRVLRNLFQDGHEHAERVVADDRAPRDFGNVPRLRHGDRQPVATIDVQHHVQVGGTVADVHDSLARHAERGTECLHCGDLAVAGGDALHRRDPDGVPVVRQPRADDVARRHDVLQRRMHDLVLRGGHHIELEDGR
jgi:hypothetical protein